MKKILALALALMMVLSLTACGGKTPAQTDSGKTESNDASNTEESTDTSQTESTENPESDKAWYDAGFRIEFVQNQCKPETQGGDGKLYTHTGVIYSDGKDILLHGNTQSAYAEEVYDELYAWDGSQVVFTKKSTSVTADVTSITGPKPYNGFTVGEYFFEKTRFGAHINDGDALDDEFRLSNFTKTNEKETVCGRSCTIYELKTHIIMSEEEILIRKWVDDELGIVLKTYDDFQNGGNGHILFEVTLFELKATDLPSVSFEKQ